MHENNFYTMIKAREKQLILRSVDSSDSRWFCGLESAVIFLTISLPRISSCFNWMPLILSDSGDSVLLQMNDTVTPSLFDVPINLSNCAWGVIDMKKNREF
jgi:hypothetical protein